MEKKNKGLVVAIIILVVISLGLGGYICYEKGLFNKFLNKETPTTDTTDKTKEDKYTDFKIMIEESSENEKYYIVGQKNEKWEEIVQTDYTATYFGEYNNKIYYADKEAFKYIDLNDKSLTPVTWIKYEESAPFQETERVFQPLFGFVKDGTIYFEMSDKSLGGGCNGTIRYVNVDATKYSDIVKIKKSRICSFDYNPDKNAIYYLEYEGEDYENLKERRVIKFDITTKKKEKIYSFDKNTVLVSGQKGKTLLAKKTKTKNEYGLYLYDLETKKEDYLTNVTETDDYDYATSGGNSERLIVDGEFIYYTDNNNVMKYENGKKTKVHKFEQKITDYLSGGFATLHNKDLLLYNSDKETWITVDGKEITDKEAKEMYSCKVTMKDGNTKALLNNDYYGDFPYELDSMLVQLD